LPKAPELKTICPENGTVHLTSSAEGIKHKSSSFYREAKLFRMIHALSAFCQQPMTRCFLASILFAFITSAFAAEPSAIELRDVEFAKVGDVSLTLDGYIPPGPGPFVTCIMVHGGGFTKGDKQSFIKPLFQPLTKAGFAWFTINYRLAPAHAWPACAEDVATAIKWVKAHAAEHRIDPSRIALIGESAGGHLVSWAGATGTNDTSVAAVVPFYAPHDLVVQVKMRNALGGLGGLIGTDELNDAAWKALADMSPINRVHPGMPPYLQIHGDNDDKVPHSQSLNFEAKMKAVGNVCETITIPGGGHGMSGWEKLGTDYQQQLIDWLRRTLK
jgi:acetyl esterase